MWVEEQVQMQKNANIKCTQKLCFFFISVNTKEKVLKKKRKSWFKQPEEKHSIATHYMTEYDGRFCGEVSKEDYFLTMNQIGFTMFGILRFLR